MSYYTGKDDPLQHLQWFEDVVSIRQMMDAIKCRLFAISFKGKARDWFHQLPSGTIYNFEDLRRSFLLRFSTSKKRRKGVEALFLIQQGVEELLGSYVDRFQEEVLLVQEVPGHTLQLALTISLRQGLFRMELARDPPLSFEELIDRAGREIESEATNHAFVAKLAKWAGSEEKAPGGSWDCGSPSLDCVPKKKKDKKVNCEMLSDVVGSPYYVAPEVLRKYYSLEADVWSAGVILYILLCGVPPFWAETEAGIFRQILQGHLDFESEPWPSISDSAKDLICNMLNRDPKKRFTAHQVLCHPWIVDDRVAPDRPLDSAVLSRLKQFSAMNKLKKMALRVIAEQLSEEEIGGLRELFKMIDTDNSGTITFDELKDGLRRVGSELTEHEIQTLMNAADIDNSGTIDYGEFLAATVHLNKLEREENLVSAFAYFDKDASGYITIDELSEACREFGLNDGHLDEMIKEIDQNNDGQIDYSEFVAMMRKGNGGYGAIGRRTMTSSLCLNLGDALKAAQQ